MVTVRQQFPRPRRISLNEFGAVVVALTGWGSKKYEHSCASICWTTAEDVIDNLRFFQKTGACYDPATIAEAAVDCSRGPRGGWITQVLRLNLIAVETALRPQGQWLLEETRAEHSEGQVSPGVGSERVLTSLQRMLAGGGTTSCKFRRDGRR